MNEDGYLEAAAVTLGEELVARATREGDKCSWQPEQATGAALASRGLTGLAHGAAGLGLALLELYRRTGRPDLRDVALGAFRYEDDWFDTEEENWADVRTHEGASAAGKPGSSERASFMTAWCYGAPGIGLSRVRATEILPDHESELRPKLEAAVKHTRRHVESRLDASPDATPCHGASGLIELLLVAEAAMGQPELGKVASRAWDRLLKRRQNSGAWATGVASGGRNQSLMLGSAGVGYSLLRFCRPE